MLPIERIHLVLRHDNVLGREDKHIHASVTQIDLHDFSRLCRTYGLGGFHCVTEMEAQHKISSDILEYWQEGFGKEYNPDRTQALEKLYLHRSFEDVVAKVTELEGGAPLIIGTSARETDKNLDFGDLLSIMTGSGRAAVVQFGTSWGLSPEQLHRCDWVLPPIQGRTGYNHLSVRCAAAIIVDRFTQMGASQM